MMGEDLRDWLEITQQQFELLKVISQLEKEDSSVTPKNIDNSYSRFYKKTIQKPNLFNQLNFLIERGIVIKTGKAQYATNLNQIKQLIMQRKDKLAKELDNCEKVTAEVEMIRSVLNKPMQPQIKYLGGDKVFQEIAIKLRGATAFDMIAGFPGIAFTYDIYGFGERGDYWRALLEGLKSGSITLRYLTSLDISYPLFYSYKIHRNKNKAINDALVIVDNLERMIKEYKNIEVRYAPHDMSGHIIIERGTPTCVFEFLRDVNRDVTNGVLIESGQVAEECKRAFMAQFNGAQKVSSSNKILESLRKQIKNNGLAILKEFKM